MKMRNLLMMLAALYAGQAVAVDASAAAGKAVPAAQHKVHVHKKDCVEKEGKPCHLHKQPSSATSKEAKPAAQAPLESIKSSVPVVAPVAAPAAAAAAAKPEVKSEAAVSAVDALALAKKQGCMVCHAIDKKIVGPGWRDVAAKYRGDATAEARLVNKIAKGGGGAWGSMPMPAHPQISEADRSTLARFVLNLQ